jgi:uncharacterized protein YndB with AHSA1/START domain
MAKNTLRVTRLIAAPRDKVFRALTEAEALTIWFAPSPMRWTVPPEVDARPGGHYCLRVEKDDKRWRVHGTYRELNPPERIVFTWNFENDPIRGEDADSVVTIELFDRDGKTEVVLTHEDLPSAAAREDHIGGWERCLGGIDQLLTGTRN